MAAERMRTDNGTRFSFEAGTIDRITILGFGSPDRSFDAAEITKLSNNLGNPNPICATFVEPCARQESARQWEKEGVYRDAVRDVASFLAYEHDDDESLVLTFDPGRDQSEEEELA